MDVRKWLEDMGLGEHAPVFEEEAIEAEEDLVDLTAEDLKDLGVAKLGYRKKILAAIKRLSEGGAAGTDSAGPPVAGPGDTCRALEAGERTLGPDHEDTLTREVATITGHKDAGAEEIPVTMASQKDI